MGEIKQKWRNGISLHDCNGLTCVLRECKCWSCTAQCGDIWRWVFSEVIMVKWDHKGEVLIRSTGVLRRRGRERPGEDIRFSPWVRKILWRREWLPTPVFLPGEFHGQRRPAGYSPWDHKKSDTTEQLTYTHIHIKFQRRILIGSAGSCA